MADMDIDFSDSVLNFPSFFNVFAMVVLASAGVWIFQMILAYNVNDKKENK